MRWGVVALVLLALLAPPRAAQAGAWTWGFGEVYAKVDAGAHVALRYLDPRTGEAVDASYVGQRRTGCWWTASPPS